MSDTTQLYQPSCRHCGTAVPHGLAFCSQCGASLEQPADGDALLDQLRALFGRDLEIEREIGQGGMAVVYAAFDPVLQRRVALKVLKSEFAEDPAVAERFRREARLIAALQHPNVVSVFAVRSSETLSAIVMQFVDGRSLDIALSEQPLLALSVAALLLTQVAAALQHAHDRGIVHRDVKPANVLLDHDGRAVVSDFGIARREGADRLTGTGVIMGTVAYMSPEQCMSGKATATSDQYSLGVMAFELLCGRRPFGGTMAQTLNAHINDPPPSMRELRSDLSDVVVSCVMRMLEKNPDARHSDLRHVERVFGALVRDARDASTVVAAMSHARAHVERPGGSLIQKAVGANSDAATVAAPIASLASPAARKLDVQPVRSRAVLKTVAGIVIVLAAMIGGWRALRSSAPTSPVTVNGTGPIHDESRTEGRLLGTPANSPGRSTAKPVAATTNTAGAISAVATSAVARGPQATPGATPAARDSSSAGASAGAAPARDSIVHTSGAATASPPTIDVPAAATLADARAAAREFVTICNQRRWKDLESLGSIGGDAALRTEFVRLVRNAPDLAAGFDRLASTPHISGERFTTEFVIDLEWRGGKRLALVRLETRLVNGSWQVGAFSVEPAE